MKSVCIVGAGPAGLVTAKTLLQAGSFTVTIFERSDKIGGIWAFEQASRGNYYLSSRTPTNLSRFSVAFSDLAWQSVGISAHKLRTFPAAADVGLYLEAYCKRHIPAETIRFGQHVVSSRQMQNEGGRWEITTQSVGGERSSSAFDYLVNAAGFFHSRPSLPPSLAVQSNVKVIHTSEFKNLEDLFGSEPKPEGKNILIFGGGNSGGETAASIAFHLSSAQHSQGALNTSLMDMKVYHVTPRPLFAIPPFIPASTESAIFAPLDLQFYELKWRQPGPAHSGSGLLPKDVADARYAAIRGMVGDQRDLGAPALVTMEETAPYVALTESYAEYVRSESIFPIAGRVTELHGSADGQRLSATVQSPTHGSTTLSDIAAVVYATGYTPNPTIDFLPDDVKRVLEYDPTSIRLPLLLQNYQTSRPEIPNLAFIGFYEGPYWGVMEMQARSIARRWALDHQVPALGDEDLSKLRELRQKMKDRAPNVPQFWFSDYTGYLEELARELQLDRNDAPFASDRDGPVTPARYLAPEDDRMEASVTMKDMKQTIDACAAGHFRARAAFRAMQGHWRLERRIASRRPEMPSGTFTGAASFYPRAPSDSAYDLEYLYVERGAFVTDTGALMTATRRYVYRYTENGDQLSVWFVDVNDERRTDYLFHTLTFADVAPGLRCEAKGDHLCEEDFYNTGYVFEFRGVSLNMFEVEHAVVGPSKDYVAKARYTRELRE